MFKHILIPTDGSAVSQRAVRAGIAFAKEAGAKVIGFHAVEPVPMRVYGEGYLADKRLLAEFERRSLAAAKKYVHAIARDAIKAGVPFEPMVRTSRTPYDGIVEAARSRNCDLIFMSSHGRRGLARIALGSVADRVMTLSKVPVLVYR